MKIIPITTKRTDFIRRIVVKALPKEEKSKGGIILPDSSQKSENTQAIVTEIDIKRYAGEGPYPKVGDKIIFTRFCGNDVLNDDEHISIVDWDEVIGIIY